MSCIGYVESPQWGVFFSILKNCYSHLAYQAVDRWEVLLVYNPYLRTLKVAEMADSEDSIFLKLCFRTWNTKQWAFGLILQSVFWAGTKCAALNLPCVNHQNCLSLCNLCPSSTIVKQIQCFIWGCVSLAFIYHLFIYSVHIIILYWVWCHIQYAISKIYNC